MLIAVGTGAGLGATGIAAFAHITDTGTGVDPRVLASMLTPVLAGTAVISLATLPLTRTAVQPTDLRHE